MTNIFEGNWHKFDFWKRYQGYTFKGGTCDCDILNSFLYESNCTVWVESWFNTPRRILGSLKFWFAPLCYSIHKNFVGYGCWRLGKDLHGETLYGFNNVRPSL